MSPPDGPCTIALDFRRFHAVPYPEKQYFAVVTTEEEVAGEGCGV